MKDSKIREPVQKRAILKKEQILKNGFNLMCEKGYHNVDCIEIAKAADVSTGTVYQYFNDKRDIFIQGLKQFTKEILFPILEYKDRIIDKKDIRNNISQIIDKTVQKHSSTKKSHEEIMAMKHSDKEIAKIFNDFELEATNVLVDILRNNSIELDNIYERAHLIIIWVDNLCHEITFHKHKSINYEKMKNLVIESILFLLNEKATI